MVLLRSTTPTGLPSLLQISQGHKEYKEIRDHKGRKDLPELMVPMGYKDPRVIRGRKEYREIPGHKGRSDQPDRKGPQGLTVPMVLRDPREIRGRKDRKEYKVIRDQWVQLDLP
ncbi:hypothetical protein, partial [Muriicola sp.]|uniref:hypothetical protein n=1 Tax=Muriicola sp. TaxID=2020856 RepID=UPI003565520F